MPNRVSPSQRNFGPITEALDSLDVILAPPISELVVAKGSGPNFTPLSDVKGTRSHDEIVRLGEFIVNYVISGELDRIY